MNLTGSVITCELVSMKVFTSRGITSFSFSHTSRLYMRCSLVEESSSTTAPRLAAPLGGNISAMLTSYVFRGNILLIALQANFVSLTRLPKETIFMSVIYLKYNCRRTKAFHSPFIALKPRTMAKRLHSWVTQKLSVAFAILRKSAAAPFTKSTNANARKTDRHRAKKTKFIVPGPNGLTNEPRIVNENKSGLGRSARLGDWADKNN